MSMKSWSGVSGQGRYIALACALVIIGTVFVFMNPYSATGRTLKTAEVSQIAPHLVDDSRVIFIVVVPVSNPSNVPVTITEVNVRMLVNGTDYLSRELQNEPLIVNPGKSFNLHRMVTLTGSPIGFQSPGIRKYTLQTEVEIHGEAKSLGMGSSNSYSFTDTRTWRYDVSPLFDTLGSSKFSEAALERSEY